MKIIPDAELLEFAEVFSEEYKNYTDGIYLSEKGTYRIKYGDVIENGALLPTFARVGNLTKEIQLNKCKVLEQSKDFIYYIIIWCWARTQVKSELEADVITIEFCKKEKKDIKSIIAGWATQFKEVPTALNISRLNALEKFIECFK